MSNKYVILTDIHIKENDKDFFKIKREELIINTISKIKEDNSITDVLLLWDTFNENKINASWYAISFFKEQVLIPLLDKNKKIHILLWNHERHNNWNVFNFINGIVNKNIKIYDKVEYYEFEDFYWLFIPFLYPADYNTKSIPTLEKEVNKHIKFLLKEIKNKNIDNKPIVALNHNMMTDNLPFDNGREAKIKLMDIKEIDFTFSWHIHKFEEFNKWVYVWSLMKSFVYTEETEWYVEFNINKKTRLVEYTRIPLTSYDYQDFTIDDYKEFNFNIIKPNTVYSIKIYFDIWTQDTMFVSELMKYIKEKGSFIKKQEILTKEIDYNVNGISNILTTDEEILEDYLNKNKIKWKAKESYFEKLKICQNMWTYAKKQAKIDKETENNIQKNLPKVNDNLAFIIKQQTEDLFFKE